MLIFCDGNIYPNPGIGGVGLVIQGPSTPKWLELERLECTSWLDHNIDDAGECIFDFIVSNGLHILNAMPFNSTDDVELDEYRKKSKTKQGKSNFSTLQFCGKIVNKIKESIFTLKFE
ncbi:hypothetical protein RFI_00600 [Reticulomyxa filosa]|uniref:RNase H type-1 domain-containing protein n=1 Tax=Reticulomyxa filosa TaxID=46433 RepID=X6PFL2_RETFI|nr:hypothetical protein RFI_00600 [Reticulomyxa filosa]|eukprot:ETO36462.1 hypothetical protein RFI_00600 [Reticulomyxa filosa]